MFFITLQLDVAWVVHERRLVGIITRNDVRVAIQKKTADVN